MFPNTRYRQIYMFSCNNFAVYGKVTVLDNGISVYSKWAANSDGFICILLNNFCAPTLQLDFAT